MVVYIGLFLIAVVLGIILTGKNPTKAKKLAYVITMFVLMFAVTVMRYGVGNDYFSYLRIYEQIAETPWNGIFSLGFEPLFAILTKAMSLVTMNSEVIYAIYAAIILTPVAIAIYRHSDNVWISVTVYLCLTFFYTSLSFIRQAIAVSVLIMAYGFMKKRKIVPTLILAVVAMLFHFTAAAFIPLYLLSLIKPTKKNIIIFSSVSVGALITCLIMKALGANPLNLVADIVTAVTGKDYSGYIGSMWFEDGFGVQYLIMPLAVLALVMISYFLGWKEKEESHMLLWLTLFNASIWSFITYAFIVERFSMFIFIFSVFTIPSVLNYFKEKAEAAKAQAVKPDKTMPGYSKKQSEEKGDNAFLITTVTVIGMFIYNCWGLYMNFHGVMPYMSISPAITDAIDGYDGHEENLAALYMNADLYTHLIQLGNTECGYVIVSTSDSYGGFTPSIRRACDYIGTGLNRKGVVETKTPHYIEFNDRNGEVFSKSFPMIAEAYTAENGISVTNDGINAVITDSAGKTCTISDDRIGLVLFNENGEIIDATEFVVKTLHRHAAKVAYE